MTTETQATEELATCCNAAEACEHTEATKEAAQEAARPAVTVRPAVDVWSTDSDVFLTADVPGAAAESVDVTIERDLLTFEAATRPVPEGFAHREFPQKLYRRSFRLSDQIDRAGVEARVTDGVLRLRLPKAAEAQPLKVQVTAN